MNTPTNKSEIWVGHYRLSNTLHGIALGYAASRDDFIALIDDYCQQHDLTPNVQLAQLPLKTWVQRHGMQGDYWRLAQQLSPANPFIFIPQENLGESKPASQQAYLVTETDNVDIVDEQWGEYFPVVIPPALKDSFFRLMDWYEDYADEDKSIKPHFDEGTQYPNYYLVIEGAKSFFFPTLFIDDMPTRCLYTGETYEKIEEASPYFVQIEPGVSRSRDFIKKLFTRHESEMFGFWDLNPNIFIRSYHDFDTVYNHMRKFTHLQGQNDAGEDKWYFFRYYDPVVFSSYIQQLSNYPERLATLFGVKDGEAIIDAYGARVDNTFYTFTLDNLPSDTAKAKIELGEFEKNIFLQMNKDKLFNQEIIPAIEKEFGAESFHQKDLARWFSDAQKQNICVETSIISYIKARCYLARAGLSSQELTARIKTEYGELTPDDMADILYEEAKKLQGEKDNG